MRTKSLATTGNKQSDRKLVEILCDPVKFARHVLGYDLWPTQEEMLRAITTHPRLGVKACHASSKTLTAALLVLWWIARYKDGIAITTAPKFEQVEKLLFAEIHKATQNSKFAYPKLNLSQVKLGPDNYALGLSTNAGVRFQGFHGAHLLVILDEAPGIESDIWEAVEGARAGGDVHVLALGNPTIVGGPFHDAFVAHRAQWKTLTIDAFDTPNLQGFTLEMLRNLPRGLPEDDPIFQYKPRPYLVTRRWVYEKYWEWGEKSGLWQAKVRGQFPENSDDTLISLAWLEAAKKREVHFDQYQGRDLVAGIDVAGPGKDETVCYVRQGPSIVGFAAWSSPDPRGQCVAFLTPYKKRLRLVNVDSIGLGYNFGMHLRDQGFPVDLVNVGQTAHDAARFANLKAECYWGLRERLEAGELAGLTDDQTIAQLATIHWKATPQGKIAIESKEEMRSRGVKSPDRADALMLAFGEHPFFANLHREVERRSAAAQAKAGYEQALNTPRPNQLVELYRQRAEEYQALRKKSPFGWTWGW
jgi:phage terminase large subunit